MEHLIVILGQTTLPFDPTKFIADPPTALLVALLIAVIYGAVKKWWVPGWLWTKSEERADSLQKTVDTLTPILKEQSEILKEIASDVRRRGDR